jgi:hypothetical protein
LVAIIYHGVALPIYFHCIFGRLATHPFYGVTKSLWDRNLLIEVTYIAIPCPFFKLSSLYCMWQTYFDFLLLPLCDMHIYMQWHPFMFMLYLFGCCSIFLLTVLVSFFTPSTILIVGTIDTGSIFMHLYIINFISLHTSLRRNTMQKQCNG